MYNFLTTAPAGGMGGSLIMIVAMFAVMYFMLIRPENKRKKEAEEMHRLCRHRQDRRQGYHHRWYHGHRCQR